MFDGINMPGLIFLSVCFLRLTLKMTKCDIQTPVTILISHVMATLTVFCISNGEDNTISEHNVILAYWGKNAA